MYPDSCGPPDKFNTSSTEQKPPAHLHCIHHVHYNTTSQEAWLVCQPLQPRYHRKKIGGRGLGAMEHTRGCPAVLLSNVPMGNESPIHRHCYQLHPKWESECWQVKQEPEPERLYEFSKHITLEVLRYQKIGTNLETAAARQATARWPAV